MHKTKGKNHPFKLILDKILVLRKINYFFFNFQKNIDDFAFFFAKNDLY